MSGPSEASQMRTLARSIEDTLEALPGSFFTARNDFSFVQLQRLSPMVQLIRDSCDDPARLSADDARSSISLDPSPQSARPDSSLDKSLRATVADQKARIGKLTSELAVARDQIAKLKAERKGAQTPSSSTTRQLEKEVKNLRQLLLERDESAKEAEGTTAELTARVCELEDQVAAYKTSEAETQDRIDSALAQLSLASKKLRGETSDPPSYGGSTGKTKKRSSTTTLNSPPAKASRTNKSGRGKPEARASTSRTGDQRAGSATPARVQRRGSADPALLRAMVGSKASRASKQPSVPITMFNKSANKTLRDTWIPNDWPEGWPESEPVAIPLNMDSLMLTPLPAHIDYFSGQELASLKPGVDRQAASGSLRRDYGGRQVSLREILQCYTARPWESIWPPVPLSFDPRDVRLKPFWTAYIGFFSMPSLQGLWETTHHFLVEESTPEALLFAQDRKTRISNMRRKWRSVMKMLIAAIHEHDSLDADILLDPAIVYPPEGGYLLAVPKSGDSDLRHFVDQLDVDQPWRAFYSDDPDAHPICKIPSVVRRITKKFFEDASYEDSNGGSGSEHGGSGSEHGGSGSEHGGSGSEHGGSGSQHSGSPDNDAGSGHQDAGSEGSDAESHESDRGSHKPEARLREPKPTSRSTKPKARVPKRETKMKSHNPAHKEVGTPGEQTDDHSDDGSVESDGGSSGRPSKKKRGVLSRTPPDDQPNAEDSLDEAMSEATSREAANAAHLLSQLGPDDEDTSVAPNNADVSEPLGTSAASGRQSPPTPSDGTPKTASDSAMVESPSKK